MVSGEDIFVRYTPSDRIHESTPWYMTWLQLRHTSIRLSVTYPSKWSTMVMDPLRKLLAIFGNVIDESIRRFLGPDEFARGNLVYERFLLKSSWFSMTMGWFGLLPGMFFTAVDIEKLNLQYDNWCFMKDVGAKTQLLICAVKVHWLSSVDSKDLWVGNLCMIYCKWWFNHVLFAPPSCSGKIYPSRGPLFSDCCFNFNYSRKLKSNWSTYSI